MTESMIDGVVFVNGRSDWDIATSLYCPCTAVRVSVTRTKTIKAIRESKTEVPLWVDPSFDGFHNNSSKELNDCENRVATKADAQRVEWKDFFSGRREQ